MILLYFNDRQGVGTLTVESGVQRLSFKSLINSGQRAFKKTRRITPMSIENIATKEPGSSRELTVSFDFQNDLDSAVAAFGADVVFAGFKADAKVGLQAKVRGMLKATEEDSEAPKYTDEEIISAIADYKPGVKTRQTSDPMAKLQALLGKLTSEQKAALLSANL
jgi:hypothetical protein